MIWVYALVPALLVVAVCCFAVSEWHSSEAEYWSHIALLVRYSHRLVELMARVEDVHADVEQLRFCDWSTFDRLSREVLDVLNGIVAETLPESRDVR
jgi:hypothetical protein